MGNKEGKEAEPRQARTKWVPHQGPSTPFNDPKYKYIYANRNCIYRNERCEFSPTEVAQIDELTQARKAFAPAPDTQNLFLDQLKALYSERPIKIIVDTDVGTDWDDVLAFLMLLHMDPKDVEILGWVTNYQPTLVRAKVATAVTTAAGRPDIPVVAGSSYICGSSRDPFWKGNEGLGIGLTKDELANLKQINDSTLAEDFLYESVKKHPKKVVICAIGMMTNLAKAATTYPDFHDLVGHVVIMGGGDYCVSPKYTNFGKHCGADVDAWGPDGTGGPGDAPFVLPTKEGLPSAFESGAPILLFPNHNTSGDTLASKILFSQKCPITLIPHDVTAQHWFDGVPIETLLEATKPGSKYPDDIRVCGALLFEWLARRGRQRGQCPHDPLTIYEAVYGIESEEKQNKFIAGTPSQNYVSGTFISAEWAAFLAFIPDPRGPHRLAVSCKEPKAYITWLSDTVMNNVPKESLVSKSDVKTEMFL